MSESVIQSVVLFLVLHTLGWLVFGAVAVAMLVAYLVDGFMGDA